VWSAGGVQALMEIVKGFPTACRRQSSWLIQLHRPAQACSQHPEPRRSDQATQARNGEPIVGGRIYVPPVDHHMLIRDGHVVVVARSKGKRIPPAVDPLFRTAASPTASA